MAALLFLSALRIGPARALGSLSEVRQTGSRVLLYQFAAPLLALAVLLPNGMTPLGFAVVLMLAAPPISGAPNFTVLMGYDPAPPMRMLVLGTALFPLTVLPVLWLLPGIEETGTILAAAVRLIAVITLASAAGFAIRHRVLPELSSTQTRRIDGLSAIALSVAVVGLMSALGPLLRDDPLTLLGWLAAVTAINLTLQVLAFTKYRVPGLAIAAGNRNIALFLVALPPAISDPILIFIGCYQVPMYLTPILMARLFRLGR